MSTFAGKIQVKQGTVADTYIRETDLIANQAIYPEIREMLEYVDQRSLATLLVSGVVKPWGLDGKVTTDFAPISKGKEIGNNGYQFDVQGRIQKSSTINGQIGATAGDGTFQLSMVDSYIDPGMNVFFYGQEFQARCQGRPTGSAGNYVYTFRPVDGTTFVYATHVTPQPGSVKTCFAGYSSYGAGSKRGYSHSFFPDRFINHMTTQRKTVKIDGDTASDKIWLTYTNDGGESVKGWMERAILQSMAQSVVEDEIAKWKGVSSMKNSTGGLAPIPNATDDEAQSQLIMGDGVLEQLAGGNELFGSGVNGMPTEDDYTDMLTQLELNSNSAQGVNIVAITDTPGYANAQRVCVNLAGNQNVNMQQIVVQDNKTGGAEVSVGYNYTKFNINGSSITFIKHPKFDDRNIFVNPGLVVFLNLGTANNKNVEIITKGANGLSRGTVDAKINGLTGSKDVMTTSEEDSMLYATLKQDMILLYNTQSCGVIRTA